MAKWTDPVSPRNITARFGQSGPNWTNKHTGLDFAAPTGTPVKAVAGGRVIFAGWANSALGTTVKIAHGDGIESWYAHLSRRRVIIGTPINQGQHIGDVGTTGNVTGAHVHLEVRVNGQPRNPEQFLGSDPLIESGPDVVPVSSDIDLTGGFTRIGLFVGGAALLLIGGYLLYQNRKQIL